MIVRGEERENGVLKKTNITLRLFNRKDDKITDICIEIEMRFGQRGDICDNPVVLEQFSDLKSVQKRGENLDKNKDQEVRRMKMILNGRLFKLLTASGEAEDDFGPK